MVRVELEKRIWGWNGPAGDGFDVGKFKVGGGAVGDPSNDICKELPIVSSEKPLLIFIIDGYGPHLICLTLSVSQTIFEFYFHMKIKASLLLIEKSFH